MNKFYKALLLAVPLLAVGGSEHIPENDYQKEFQHLTAENRRLQRELADILTIIEKYKKLAKAIAGVPKPAYSEVKSPKVVPESFHPEVLSKLEKMIEGLEARNYFNTNRGEYNEMWYNSQNVLVANFYYKSENWERGSLNRIIFRQGEGIYKISYSSGKFSSGGDWRNADNIRGILIDTGGSFEMELNQASRDFLKFEKRREEGIFVRG